MVNSSNTATVCPKCGSTAGGSDDSCTQCGILFSKWKERENNVAAGNTARYATIANATSSGFNWTILAIVVITVIAIWYFVQFKNQ